MSLFNEVTAFAPRLNPGPFDDAWIDVPAPDSFPTPEPDPRFDAGLRSLDMFGPAPFFRTEPAGVQGFAGAMPATDAATAPSLLQPTGLGGALGALTDPYVYGPCLPGAIDGSRMPAIDQGSSNACGTSSLAMIMGYLGVPVSRQDIDREIRRVDEGLPPKPMIDYARSHGLNAEGYNNGTWDEIKGYVERGIPVQANINTKGDGSVSNLHWVAVVGFRTDPATGKEQIGLRDSAEGGKVVWKDRADFESQWRHPCDGTEYDNFFIAYAPPGTDLPPGRWDGVEGHAAMNDGVWHLLNNFDRLVDPDSVGGFVHGLIGLPGGIVQTVGGALGYGVQTAGQWLDQKVGDIPVLGWIARPVGKLLDGVGAGIGNIFGGIGDGINAAGGAFEKLFKGDVGGFFGGLFDAGSKVVGGFASGVGSFFQGVGNAAGSVVNTVADGAKAVGNAIADGAKAVGNFFSSIF